VKQIVLNRLFPFLQWFPMLTAKTAKADFIAGLTGAVVVLPQGVAFAAIAGMPPEYGLYAAIVPAIIAALFGSSWHLISGPTTAASLVMFSTLSSFATPESPDYIRLALTLTFMVGITQLLMGIAKLGTLVNFISHSVIIGFTAGAAILIASSQAKVFFGLVMPGGLHPHEVLINIMTHTADINIYATAVAVITLVSGILAKKLIPRFPYMILALVVGSLSALLLNFLFGPDVTNITNIGALKGNLPPLSSPDFSIATIKQLAPAVLAICLLALTEAVSISRSIAVRSGQHIDSNQEFIGQGLSNMFGSFFSAYVATGSFNRSGVNYEAGAKTPLAAIVAAIMLIVILTFVAPYAAYLPKATMAGILVLVAWGLIDFFHIKKIIKTDRSESAILLITFFSTLVLELEFAIILGVVLSLVVYLSKTSRPRMYSRMPDPTLGKRKFSSNPNLDECPQLKLLRIDGSLFFGATNYVAEYLQELTRSAPQQKNLLILAQGINFVDIAGAELLAKEAKNREKLGGNLFMYRVKPGACEILKHGFVDKIGANNFFDSKTTAISTIFKGLDKAVCATCTKRIFKECESIKQ